ncbi:hypothetical protein pb186bvf_000521 [Paramecium bursaria]
MSQPKVLLSPQPQQQQVVELFRSEKVKKTGPFAEIDQDATIVKFDNTITTVLNKQSLNNTRLVQPEFSNRLDFLQAGDESVPMQSRLCCYCSLNLNLIQICPCSTAHYRCANRELEKGCLITTARCPNCKELRHLEGVITFDISKWRENLQAIIISSVLLSVLIGFIIAISYIALVRLNNEVRDNRFFISCLVFSYTIGFILFVCIISKLVSQFKKIEYRIKKYDARNTEFNRQYINILVNM